MPIGEKFDASKVLHRFMVWGDSGAGKTGCVCLAAEDLDLDLESDAVLDGAVQPHGDAGIFLLAGEANALVTARLFNPKIQYQLVSSKADVLEVIKAAAAGELAHQGVHTLAIDGGTEVQRLLKDAAIGSNENNAASDRFDWQLFNETVRRFLRTVRALPLHVVMTALVRVRENEETKSQEIMPAFEGGKTPGEVAQYFAASGYASRMLTMGGDYRHVVQFSGLPSRYKIKAAGAIRGAVRPCAQAWMRVLDGELPRNRIQIAGLVQPVTHAAPAPAADAAPADGSAPTTAARPGRPGRAAPAE